MIAALTMAAALTIGPQPGQTHSECLRATTTSLEPSGERPADIAAAAVTACGALEPKPTSENRLGQMTASDRQEVMNAIREGYRNNIAARIIAVRACKKTPACSVANLSWFGLGQ